MAVIPQGSSFGSEGTGSGWIVFGDVTPQGGDDVVDTKTYQDTPNDTVIQTCRATSLDLTFGVRASYPIIDIEGTPFTLPAAADGGHYEGDVNLTITGSGTITATVKTGDALGGAQDNIEVTVVLPAQFTSLLFTGPYPTGALGLQTEVKEDDTFQIAWTTDKPIDGIQTTAFGALKSELIAFASASSGTITATIADQGAVLQVLSGRAKPRDAVTAALGPERDTNLSGGNTDAVNVLNLNNLAPTNTFGSPTYPASQSALKASEQATVPSTVANADGILYDSPNGDLSVTNPGTIEATKTVTRIAGSYNISTNNLRAVATRAANGAQTTAQRVVNIANVAPTIDITLPAARLRSGGNNGTAAQDHTVTVTANQQLLNAPTLLADAGGSRGTFQGGGFAGGPSAWTRDLRIDETVPDEKGTFAFSGLVATGLAGLVQNTINSGASYTLGGFVSRNLTFSAFATTTSLDTEVVDFSKIAAGIFTATNQAALRQPISTAPPVTNGYTIDATGVNPTSLIWLDTAAAGSNSGGTAQITNVEETV